MTLTELGNHNSMIHLRELQALKVRHSEELVAFVQQVSTSDSDAIRLVALAENLADAYKNAAYLAGFLDGGLDTHG